MALNYLNEETQGLVMERWACGLLLLQEYCVVLDVCENMCLSMVWLTAPNVDNHLGYPK